MMLTIYTVTIIFIAKKISSSNSKTHLKFI
jgi:hypothetical protein